MALRKNFKISQFIDLNSNIYNGESINFLYETELNNFLIVMNCRKLINLYQSHYSNKNSLLPQKYLLESGITIKILKRFNLRSDQT